MAFVSHNSTGLLVEPDFLPLVQLNKSSVGRNKAVPAALPVSFVFCLPELHKQTAPGEAPARCLKGCESPLRGVAQVGVPYACWSVLTPPPWLVVAIGVNMPSPHQEGPGSVWTTTGGGQGVGSPVCSGARRPVVSRRWGGGGRPAPQRHHLLPVELLPLPPLLRPLHPHGLPRDVRHHPVHRPGGRAVGPSPRLCDPVWGECVVCWTHCKLDSWHNFWVSV